MKVLRKVLLTSLIFALHTPHPIAAEEESSSLSQQRLIKALKGQKKNAFDEWASEFEANFKHLKTAEHLTAAGAYESLGNLRSLILRLPQSNFAPSEMGAISAHLNELRTFLDRKVDIARGDLGTDTGQVLMTPHATTIKSQRDEFSILHAGDQENDFRVEDEPEVVAARLERVLEFASRQGGTKKTVVEKAIAFNFEQALSYFKAGNWAEREGAIEFACAFCRLVKYVADLNEKTRQILLGPSESGLDPITRYFIPEPESGQQAHHYSVAQKLVYAYALLNAGYDRPDLINAAFDLQLDFKFPVVKKFAPAFLRLTAQKLLSKNYALGMDFAEDLFKRLDSFIHPFGAHGLDGAALAIEFKIVVQDIDGTVSKLGTVGGKSVSAWQRFKNWFWSLFAA